MVSRTERLRLRLSDDELEFLKEQADASGAKFKNGKTNLSRYVRETLLAGSGLRDEQLQRGIRSLAYEFRKIGTNINQIARKINADIGTPEDLIRLTDYLDRIETKFAGFLKEVEEHWPSQS